MQRFPQFSKDEISKMVFGQLTPLEQTKAYQEIIAEGITQGITQGVDICVLAGQIMMIEELLGLEPTSLEDLKRLSVGMLKSKKSELKLKYLRTDKQLFEIFQAAPWLLAELLQFDSPHPCSYGSLTVKSIEKEADGVLVLHDRKHVEFIEWQFYRDPEIYNRIVITMASLQNQYPGCTIQGTIIFASGDLDPKTSPWESIIRSVYLEELLTKLKSHSVSHPLLALFVPIIESSEELLRQTLPACYTTLQSAEMPQSARDILSKIFLDWVMQRFPQFSKDEISKMVLGQLTPLEQSKAYQEIFAEGVDIGVLAGQIMMIEELLGLEATSLDELKRLSVDVLKSKKSELQSKLLRR